MCCRKKTTVHQTINKAVISWPSKKFCNRECSTWQILALILHLNFGLNIVNCVTAFDFESDSLSSQSLHKDLHFGLLQKPTSQLKAVSFLQTHLATTEEDLGEWFSRLLQAFQTRTTSSLRYQRPTVLLQPWLHAFHISLPGMCKQPESQANQNQNPYQNF